jgi:hypothetical protein
MQQHLILKNNKYEYDAYRYYNRSRLSGIAPFVPKPDKTYVIFVGSKGRTYGTQFVLTF